MKIAGVLLLIAIIFFAGIVYGAYLVMKDTGEETPRTVLQFEKESENTNWNFWYTQNENNEYLRLLCSKFPIDSVIMGAQTDMEKTLKIMNWVHNQWQHNGNNTPQKNDAISILEEAKEGENFCCVEYGIVISACLKSVGLNARTIGLKTKDVETRQSGAGHVATEVYLNDLKK